MNVSPTERAVNAAALSPEQLAGNSTLTEREKIHEASRQFEAILVRQILDSAQKPVIQSKFADQSTAGTIYRDMVTNQLADSISKTGALGLAQTFEQQLQRPAAMAPAAQSPGAGSTPVPKPHLHYDFRHGAELLRGPLRPISPTSSAKPADQTVHAGAKPIPRLIRGKEHGRLRPQASTSPTNAHSGLADPSVRAPLVEPTLKTHPPLPQS